MFKMKNFMLKQNSVFTQLNSTSEKDMFNSEEPTIFFQSKSDVCYVTFVVQEVDPLRCM